MAVQLCSVCRSISSQFWSETYDFTEYCYEIRAKLQSLKSMKISAAIGCQLCTILVKSIRYRKPDDENECLYLRRAHADPHRGICLATEQYTYRISHATFYHVPQAWCKIEATGLKGSVDNLRLMDTWLQECDNCHKCGSGQRIQFLPTRLLDLRARGIGDDIRLVSSQDIGEPVPQYLTLSHCWGPPETHSIKTLSSSLKQRMSRIPLKDLSNTFHDAVRISRDLGQQYLWIDSLCIIQDSPEDWAKEASLMAEVYGNAYCTLAALSSKDSTEGCNLVTDLQHKINSSFIDFDIENSARHRIRIFQDKPKNWQEEYEGSPLSTRAWVLQERELSRRTIHFAQNQLLWECQELKASAQLPWQEEKESIQELNTAPWAMRNRLDEHVSPHNDLVINSKYTLFYREQWYKLVEGYSSRTLTYGTDKLPALSGLAKHNQAAFPDAQYLAGLWTTHLPAALLWQTSSNDTSRYEAYTAPTWSWASIKGPITYDSQRLEPSGNSFDRSPAHESFSTFNTLRFYYAVIITAHASPYGAISGASLNLRGAQIVAVDPLSQHQPCPDGEGEPLLKKSTQIGVFFRDVSTEHFTGEHVYCLRVRSEPQFALTRHDWRCKMDREMQDTAMGLVLAECSEGAYRRVGLARWVAEDIFEKIEGVNVELV